MKIENCNFTVKNDLPEEALAIQQGMLKVMESHCAVMQAMASSYTFPGPILEINSIPESDEEESEV